MLTEERRQHILAQIQAAGKVQAAHLAAHFGVSRMTIHRDLAYLHARGWARKVFGGAVAMETESVEPAAGAPAGGCAMCGARLRQRTAFVLQCADGARLHACCPHCGLMLLAGRGDVVSALAADFLHGRMINVRDAAFLVGPELSLCCAPTILCFASRAEGERFRQGFGGDLLDHLQAQASLQQSMALHP
ncbi:MAG: DeoR/GlpR transcriptional regulator [Caldilineales bacterium]|nr:DeoR/GlpR transcriptional regulator [Caldilineales bacterium]